MKKLEIACLPDSSAPEDADQPVSLISMTWAISVSFVEILWSRKASEGQHKPWSDCAAVQADWSLWWLHIYLAFLSRCLKKKLYDCAYPMWLICLFLTVYVSDEIKTKLHIQKVAGYSLSCAGPPYMVAAYVPGAKVLYCFLVAFIEYWEAWTPVWKTLLLFTASLGTLSFWFVCPDSWIPFSTWNNMPHHP